MERVLGSIKKEMPHGGLQNRIWGVIFTILVVLYPILKIYYISESITAVCLADIFMVLLLPVLALLLVRRNYIRVDHGIMILLFYILGHFFIVNVLILGNVRDVLFNMAHYIFVLLILGVLLLNFWNQKLALNVLRITAEVSTVYLIFQYVCLYIFGTYVSGQIPFFYALTARTGAFRPFSFFSEPAEYGTYAAIALAVQMFDKERQTARTLISSILISAGVLLSRSSAGIGLTAGLWFFWVLRTVYHSKNKEMKKLMLLFVVGVPAIIFLSYKLDIWNFIYTHVFKSQEGGEMARGLSNRVSGYMYALNYHDKNIFAVLFGQGMVTPQEFVPGIGRLYIYYGITGFLVYAVYLAALMKKVNFTYKVLLLFMLAASFFSDMIFGLAGLYYLPYVIYSRYQQSGKRTE